MKDLTKILKAGDKVYSPAHGNGFIASISRDPDDKYPIEVIFEGMGQDLHFFTPEGKMFIQAPECILFPSKDERDWDNYISSSIILPFNKVLVRNYPEARWLPQFFLYYEVGKEAPFHCVQESFKYCIPYEGNENKLLQV